MSPDVYKWLKTTGGKAELKKMRRSMLIDWRVLAAGWISSTKNRMVFYDWPGIPLAFKVRRDLATRDR